MKKRFRLAIVNANTGDIVEDRTLSYDSVMPTSIISQDVLSQVQQMSTWFDKQDTFFSSRKLWDHWVSLGIDSKFASVANGRRPYTSETVVVFPKDGGRGQEHALYLENLDYK